MQRLERTRPRIGAASFVDFDKVMSMPYLGFIAK